MTLLPAQNYKNWLMNVKDKNSKPNHRHFRDMVYNITEKTISGVYASLGSAVTLVGRGGVTNNRSIAYSVGNISAKNYQNLSMCFKVIVCNISVFSLDTVFIFHQRSPSSLNDTTVYLFIYGQSVPGHHYFD